jgi:hypothetical protein
MIKRWIGYLVASSVLLWAKLPGPSSQDTPEEFRVRREGTTESDLIEITTKAEKLGWLSPNTNEIIVQRVQKQQTGRWLLVENTSQQIPVQVEMPSPSTARVRIKPDANLQELLSGTGSYAIVTGTGQGDQFSKEAEMIVEGKGSGVWGILKSLFGK